MRVADTGDIIEALVDDALPNATTLRTRPGPGEPLLDEYVYYAIGGGTPDTGGSPYLRREVDFFFGGDASLEYATKCQIAWMRREPSVVANVFVYRVEPLIAPIEIRPTNRGHQVRQSATDEPTHTIQSYAIIHAPYELPRPGALLLSTGGFLLLDNGGRLLI